MAAVGKDRRRSAVGHDWRRVLGSSQAPGFSGAGTGIHPEDSGQVDLGMLQEMEEKGTEL